MELFWFYKFTADYWVFSPSQARRSSSSWSEGGICVGRTAGAGGKHRRLLIGARAMRTLLPCLICRSPVAEQVE